MKYILELILATIIIFFLWNILKRMFLSNFYKFPRPENRKETQSRKTSKNLDSKINWDAETVDYEEVKENKDKEK